jgi:hypothetical protein
MRACFYAIPNTFFQRSLYPVLVFCFSTIHLGAQNTERIVIKAGEDLSTALGSHGLYRFAGFKRGIVNFKDGTFGRALLNYNVILNDIQFISPKGDTLSLDDVNLVDSIHIDSTVFYYEKGYVQVVCDYNESKLVMRQVNSVQYLKKGALGLPNPTVHTFSYNQAQTTDYTGLKLMINEDVVILKEITYYLVYKKFRQAPALLGGFVKAFPSLKDEIRQFVNENKINFNLEADLNRLLKFCVEHSG